MQSLVACAEVEVTAEVIKRTGRALEARAAAGELQLAQADTVPRSQTDASASPAISPLLQPAPNVFERTGIANWDGKRTLQGIWIAHPDATVARRVRIYNAKNGRVVDGALFKRDSTFSDTNVLISSQAAEELGLTPGEPTELRIVAISPTRTASTSGTEESTDARASAAAAAEAESSTSEPAETVTVATLPQPAAEAPSPTPAAKPEEIPAIVTPRPRVAAPPKTESVPAPETEAPQLAATAPTPAPVPAARPVSDGSFKWESPPVASEEPAEKQPARTAAKPKPEKLAAAPATAKRETAAPARTQANAPRLDKPFVQAGIFGVPENAAKLVRRLRDKGIPARALALKSQSSLQRVIAGPFTDRAERDEAQKAIRGMGLKDAVPVRR